MNAREKEIRVHTVQQIIEAVLLAAADGNLKGQLARDLEKLCHAHLSASAEIARLNESLALARAEERKRTIDWVLELLDAKSDCSAAYIASLIRDRSLPTSE